MSLGNQLLIKMQQITPIEIRQKRFGKSFRGYNPDEVSAFLHVLADTWKALLIRLDTLEAMLHDSKQEVKRLQEIENKLLRTIQDAEMTAQHITEQAKKEAALQIKSAELETAKIIRETQERMKALQEAYDKKHQYRKVQTERVLGSMQEMIQKATTYRDVLFQELQHTEGGSLANMQCARPTIHIDNNEAKKHAKALSPDAISGA